MFLFHTALLLYHCEHGGVDLMGLKPNPLDLSAFSALTLLVRSLIKPVPDMTYNVFGGTLNLTLLLLEYMCAKNFKIDLGLTKLLQK